MTPEGRALGLAYGVVGAFALVGMACVASWWEPSVPVDRWPPPALTYTCRDLCLTYDMGPVLRERPDGTWTCLCDPTSSDRDPVGLIRRRD